jgi:hypothetical protein
MGIPGESDPLYICKHSLRFLARRLVSKTRPRFAAFPCRVLDSLISIDRIQRP